MNYRSLLSFILLLLMPNICASVEKQRELLDKAADLLYESPSQSALITEKVLNQLSEHNEENHDIYIEALTILGRSYDLQGDFDLGIQVYHDALDLCNPSDKRLIALINLRMCSLYRCLKDFSKSYEFIETATSMYKALGDSSGIAQCYNSRGLIHTTLEENKAAEKYFLQALEINRKINDQKSVAANLNNLCLYEGNSEEKIKLLEEAISINRARNANWPLGENYNNMGIQYFYAGNYRMALTMLDKAMTYAEKLNAKELMCDNYRYKSWVYDSLHRYDKAYSCFLKLYEMEQQIQSEKNLRNIERSMSQKALLKKAGQIQLMDQMHKNQILKNSLIFSVSLLILGIFSLSIFWKRDKDRKRSELYRTKLELEQSNSELLKLKLRQEEIEKQKMETKLSTNKRDLTNFAYYIRSRNEMLSKIKDQIKEAYRMDHSLIHSHLRRISAFISQYETSDDNKLLVVTEIEQYNEDFISRLDQKHPDLTKSEKQLSAFLRIELSTKEICLMTGSNIKAINMARYRLRKRLNLNPEDSISEYLQNI
ncbi:MAG: tetratricopeptide repeat protein [Bacteroidales bacterium]